MHQQTICAEVSTLSHEDERRYRDLVENLNDVVYATDQHANITYVSPNITQVGGYLPSEVIGRNFITFVHPEDLTGRIEQFGKVLSGKNESSEYRFLTKSGRPVWVRTSARAILVGNEVVGVQGVLVDISDRKTAEEALRRSEEKYRILVENAKDGILVIQDKRIRFMNASASDILGHSLRYMAETPFDALIHPEDRDRIMARHWQRLAGAPMADTVSFKIICKDNVIKHIDLNAVRIEWDKKPAVLAFMRDITARLEMAERLRQTQQLEALGTLAGGIAHNFNNLLMGIQGNTSLALIQLEPSHPICDRLQNILQLVQNGSKLTQQLLQYTHGGRHEFGPVDLNQLVTNISAVWGGTQKQLRIHEHLANDLPDVVGDRQQIEQVLLNLLLNAADAMPNGGDVHIETACMSGPHTMGEGASTDKRPCVMLKVADTGTGMSKTVMNRIFEPFFTTKGLGRGAGLGLPTAYGIIKNHGGRIEVTSEVNHGTCMTVCLPAATHPGPSANGGIAPADGKEA